jgi:hypothetical protein
LRVLLDARHDQHRHRSQPRESVAAEKRPVIERAVEEERDRADQDGVPELVRVRHRGERGRQRSHDAPMETRTTNASCATKPARKKVFTPGR